MYKETIHDGYHMTLEQRFPNLTRRVHELCGFIIVISNTAFSVAGFATEQLGVRNDGKRIRLLQQLLLEQL